MHRACALLLLLCCWLVPAWAEVAVPTLTARVTDQTGTLRAGEIAALEGKLAAFEARKGSQIAVLIVPSTQTESIEQYAIRVVERWRLGRKGVDDGVLLLVAKDDRKVRIEVGYGLEGALTDARSSRIIRNVIQPAFRAGDFYGGLDAAADQLIAVIDGEPLPEAERDRAAVGHDLSLFGLHPIVLLGILFGGVILSKVAGNWIGSGGVAGVSALAALSGGQSLLAAGGLIALMVIALMVVRTGLFIDLLGMLFSHSRSGTRIGGGDGFGGGGFGGGGFSGGGGGFGGGGASGGW
ncbi:TPM domain-containing protein [Chitinolyticbacter meiyuanensis]|uniref:TPM domain-containing protein n=1 Tax=Chitinolyticbacter meiyuanensis TaxID=682798 RepID=UPI0011E5F492|nr:YgcG family protein [Chitinolyticbacter meiyuanensis]